MVSSEVIIHEHPPPSREPKARGSSKKGLYPPMPKSDLAQQGRVQVLEEMMSSDEDEQYATVPSLVPVPNRRGLTGRKRKSPADGTTDWERVSLSRS